MRKCILLIVCIICGISIKAQDKTEYQSIFGEQTTSFNVTMSILDGGALTDSFYYAKDTLINSLSYKLFYADIVYPYNSFKYQSYALRENETRSQTYIRRLNDGLYEGDTIDYLVCDMDLNKGDSFVFPVSTYFPLYTVDSVFFDDQQLKHLILKEGESQCEFIEGTGLNRRMFLRGYDEMQWSIYNDNLICAYKDGIRTYTNPSVMTNGKCVYGYVGISPVPEPKKILPYPNPAKDFFILNIPDYSQAKGQIEILNLLGQCVQKQSVTHSQQKINVEHLSAGIYFVHVVDVNGTSYSAKLLITK